MDSFEAHSRHEAQKHYGMLAEMSHQYATLDAWGTIRPPDKYHLTRKSMNCPMTSIAEQPDPQSAVNIFGVTSHPGVPCQALWQQISNAAHMVGYNQSVTGLPSAPTLAGPTLSSPLSSKSPKIEFPCPEHTTHDTWYTGNTFEQTEQSFTDKPKKVGRKRKTSDAEPGSERAIYLEKNRKAASRCRSKQRRQQEDLVEEARRVQARNTCLKAEVGILRHDLRGCVEIASHHQSCSDSRLSIYLQRAADRLAFGYNPKPSTPYSSASSTQMPRTPPMEEVPGDGVG